MATELELVGVKGFTKDVQSIYKQYRTGIVVSLAANLNNIRRVAASQFIIPRDPSISPREHRNYILRKKQPVNPTKLTTRQGRLHAMLMDDINKPLTAWTGIKQLANGSFGGNKQASLRTRGIFAKIEVTSGFKTKNETYSAKLVADITNTSGLINVKTTKIRDKDGNVQKVSRTKETKQTLFMRFMHEKGIRGRKRPFVYPAAVKEEFRTSRLISEKLNILGRL